MILPELDDATLEWAAQELERFNLGDLAGIAARRKRDREDAALRGEARRQMRAAAAAHLRAMMKRPELSAIAVLSRLADLRSDFDHAAMLRDAWPLAWKGWVEISATIQCASNSIPPAISYRIALTDRGREVLASGA